MTPPARDRKKPVEDAAKTTRFEARLTPYTRKIIQRAAEIQGRSMSDFVVAAAAEAAERAVKDAQIIELTLDDQLRVAEAILNPPEPGPAWKKAVETYRRLVRESR